MIAYLPDFPVPVSAYVRNLHRLLIGSCLAPQEEHRGDAGLRRLLEVELVHVLHRLYSAFDDAVAARPRLYKASERKSHPTAMGPAFPSKSRHAALRWRACCQHTILQEGLEIF
jgi:hypothetical protein